MFQIDHSLLSQRGHQLRKGKARGSATALLAALLICLSFMLLSAQIAHAHEIVDDDPVTQRNGMHVCPVRYLVVGVHAGNNALLCSHHFRFYRVSQEFVDEATQRKGMHACPVGSAVTGFHADDNLLSCAPLRIHITSEFVDEDDGTPTQRHGMHACPRGSVLLGIHRDNNDLLCGTP